jgi:hypothetical protein
MVKIYYGVPWITTEGKDHLLFREMTAPGKFKPIKYDDIAPKDVPGDLVAYSIGAGQSADGSGEVYHFSEFSGIDGHRVWKDLKQHAWNVYFHQGDPFNYMTLDRGEEYAFIKRYDPACEGQTIPDAGRNYVLHFSISKRTVVKTYADKWRDYLQVKDKPRMPMLFEKPAYLIDKEKLLFLQGNKEFQAIGMLGKFLVVKHPQKNVYHLKQPLGMVTTSPEIKIPVLPASKTLLGILGTVSGSSSTRHSITDVYMLLKDEALEKATPVPAVLQKYKRVRDNPLQYFENMQSEAYTTRWGVLTVVTYRSDIDDYDVNIFLGDRLIEESQAYKYSKELGPVKVEAMRIKKRKAELKHRPQKRRIKRE